MIQLRLQGVGGQGYLTEKGQGAEGTPSGGQQPGPTSRLPQVSCEHQCFQDIKSEQNDWPNMASQRTFIRQGIVWDLSQENIKVTFPHAVTVG